jgi:hypothetical protein
MSQPCWSGAAARRRVPDRAGPTTVVAVLVAALLAIITPCRADSARGAAKHIDMDTEDLFGFVEGSDIGDKGEREFESDAVVRAGRSTGRFNDTAAEFQYKHTIFENFRISAAATFAYYDIAGVTDMDDRHAAALQSLSFDARFRLLDRERSPFGLTLSLEPHWGFADETSGGAISHFGWEGVLMADRELVPNRLFGALNLHFDTDRTVTRPGDGVAQQPTLGVGLALAGHVMPNVWMGGEMRYLRSYEGAALETFTGQALYLGPTLYAKIGEKGWFSAAFSFQAWGGAVGTPGALDLSNFERYQAKLRFGYMF